MQYNNNAENVQANAPAEYTDLEEAIKNNGIFVDNFGNKFPVREAHFPGDNWAMNCRYHSHLSHVDKNVSLFRLDGGTNFSTPFDEPPQVNQWQEYQVFYGEDSKLYFLKRISKDDDIIRAYDEQFYYIDNDNRIRVQEGIFFNDGKRKKRCKLYQKNNQGSYEKQYVFDATKKLDQFLGVIDGQLFATDLFFSSSRKIYVFDEDGNQVTAIELPRKLKTTPEKLFHISKQRYNEEKKEKLKKSEIAATILPTTILPNFTQILCNIAKDTVATNLISDPSLSQTNQKLVEKTIKKIRQPKQNKNIGPEQQYNINLSKSKKAEYKDEYNFDKEPYQPKKTNAVHGETNGKFKLYGNYNHKDEYNFDKNTKYQPQVRNIARDVKKNKWLTDKGWQVSK